VPVYLMRSNLNMAALKQADGLAGHAAVPPSRHFHASGPPRGRGLATLRPALSLSLWPFRRGDLPAELQVSVSSSTVPSGQRTSEGTSNAWQAQA
jgi:hypothetical protein